MAQIKVRISSSETEYAFSAVFVCLLAYEIRLSGPSCTSNKTAATADLVASVVTGQFEVRVNQHGGDAELVLHTFKGLLAWSPVEFVILSGQPR